MPLVGTTYVDGDFWRISQAGMQEIQGVPNTPFAVNDLIYYEADNDSAIELRADFFLVRSTDPRFLSDFVNDIDPYHAAVGSVNVAGVNAKSVRNPTGEDTIVVREESLATPSISVSASDGTLETNATRILL